jgi:type IV pilus assembly protein PilA
MAVEKGLPRAAADSFALSLDGSVVRAGMTVDLAPLFESSTNAFTGYMNRSKTSEARVQIAKMFDAASAYFDEEHVSRADVAIIGAGGALAELAPHQCPNDGSSTGESGVTPPLSVDCSKGPGGRCTPVAGEPSGPGEYSASAWTDAKVWNALNFQQETPHYFHYNFRWSNQGTGFGSCQFTAQAFGDLDGDGVFSTYERAGAADQNGVNAAAGLYIDRELE